LIIGGALGAGLHFGLGWATVGGSALLGYLLAMGTGATAGVLAGKPPWRQAAWIEGVLKAVAGLGFGALAYWLGSSYASFGLPGLLPGLEAGTPWNEATLVMPTVVAGLFGALVELDNTDADATPKGAKRGPKVRVQGEKADAEVVEAAAAKPASKVKTR
jgi:hypothetical protein